MNYYLLLLILSIFGIFLNIKWQKTLSLGMVVSMMTMCTFRGVNIGTDTLTYMNYAMGNSGGENYGPIYVLLREISQLTVFPPTAFVGMMAILTYIPLFLVCHRYSKIPCMTLFLFMSTTAIYFMETFNICRQALAIMYVLLAVINLNDTDRTKSLKSYISQNYVSFTLLAFAFMLHAYIILFLPFFLLKRIKLSGTRILFFFTSSIFIGLFLSEAFISFMINIMSSFFGSFDNAFISHLSKFSNYDYSSEYTLVGKFIHVLPYGFLLLFTFNKNYTNTIIYKMLFWGLCLLSMCLFSVFCERIACTYTIAIIIAIPNVFHALSKQQKILVSLVFAYFIYNYVTDMLIMETSNLNYPVPYYSILENGL